MAERRLVFVTHNFEEGSAAAFLTHLPSVRVYLRDGRSLAHAIAVNCYHGLLNVSEMIAAM
jgi:hypothetical protein